MNALLISDVDGTLLGDDDALEHLIGDLRRWGIAIAYCSGRTPESLAADVGAGRLPEPVAIVGAVGTEIVIDGTPCTAWSEQLDAKPFDADRIRRFLGCEPGLMLQPASEQRRFKVSYFAPGLKPARLDRLRTSLLEAGQEVNLVYSSERDLDVLPVGIDKGAAARFLAAYLGAEQVYTSGDSNNDRALLTAGFQGIVVGNAEPALKTLEGHASVVLAKASFAAGVREGITHWRS